MYCCPVLVLYLKVNTLDTEHDCQTLKISLRRAQVMLKCHFVQHKNVLSADNSRRVQLLHAEVKVWNPTRSLGTILGTELGLSCNQ